MNKIWPYFIISIMLISPSIYQQSVLAISLTTTTKTYQDFGLGFRIEYPSNLVLNKGLNNITLNNLQPFNSASHFRAIISVNPWIKAVGLSGIRTLPSLDIMARHFGLSVSDQNATVTNKTKLTLGNSTGYLIRYYKTLHNGHTIYGSAYLALKGDLVYAVIFYYSDQAKSLPIEQKIAKSFRFI